MEIEADGRLHQMRIKKLNKDKIEKVYLLGKKEFKGQYWYKKRFIEESMNMNGLHYGIFDKNNLVGVILVNLYDKPKAWIFFFVIEKEYQRTGLGTKLLKNVEKNLPKGYFLIIVDVGKRDRIAKRFYEKRGFVKKAEIEDWFGEKESGLIYIKKLISSS